MSDISHRVDGSIWLIEIHRPERANALRLRTIRELEAVMDAAEAPDSDGARGPGAGARGVVPTAATKALLALLDSGEGFDPAEWQPEREARLASPERREALEARRAAINRDRQKCD